MNSSTIHSPFFYKYASHSLHIAALASTSKKQSAVLCDEEEVGAYLLLSESEGSLSYLQFVTDNELDDHVLIDVVNDETMKMTVLFKTLFGRTRKTVRDKRKISWSALDLKALRKCDRNCGCF
jgi:hypothetical protein